MPKPILYFTAAGAACVGGPAAAAVLFRRGQQEAAAHLHAQEAECIRRSLQKRIDLEPLREQARAIGVDPDLVEQGYRDVRDGLLPVEQFIPRLRALAQD